MEAAYSRLIRFLRPFFELALVRWNVHYRFMLIAGFVTIAGFQFATAQHVAAAEQSGSDNSVIIQTEHGPVKGKIVRPESSREKPGDVGKRVHTPLEVVVPEKPIEPPVPRSNKEN